MRFLKWLVENIIFCGLIYFGLVEEVSGAYTLAMVIAWLTIVSSLIVVVNKDAIERVKDEKRPVPDWFNNIYDTLIAAVFIWFGHVITGVLYLMHTYWQNDIFESIDKLNKESNAK